MVKISQKAQYEKLMKEKCEKYLMNPRNIFFRAPLSFLY